MSLLAWCLLSVYYERNGLGDREVHCTMIGTLPVLIICSYLPKTKGKRASHIHCNPPKYIIKEEEKKTLLWRTSVGDRYLPGIS